MKTNFIVWTIIGFGIFFFAMQIYDVIKKRKKKDDR